jgi:hypothetical protein
MFEVGRRAGVAGILDEENGREGQAKGPVG